MAEKPEKQLDFEASLKELEALVERLEGGDLSLEESLKAFESGVTLTRQCRDALEQAEQKVQKLSGNGDNGQLSSFEEGEDGESN